ncbi:hypothetical protein TNCT_681491 [Trichonephila clavata]|uniref:Uncharacterized protein n=1 Tax=Trichonephila clavata TaxID=2740835 RepID=A0A8X6LQ24_TRICU|nr:hypothetical protein TNCT_681491 [Trichonephila clavata]
MGVMAWIKSIQNECDDIKLIFKFFFLLGVPYPDRNISLVLRIFEKILCTFYSILSICIFALNTCRFIKDSFERQALAANLHFTFAVILRLYLVFKGKLITKELSSLQKIHSKYDACPQKSLKLWIIIGSLLGYITALIGISCMLWVTPESVRINNKFYSLDLDIPEPYEDYFSVFPIMILFVTNILLFTGQDLAVVLICSFYQKLGCFISDCQRVLAAAYSEETPTPKIIHNFSTTVNLLSTSILKIDRVLSPLAFYLLCLFLFQILELTTIFMRDEIIFWHVMFGGLLVITLIPKLILLVMLGSRIHERFAEIKELVLKAPILNERILYEMPSGINHIALFQLVDSLSDSAFMTAMGIIKIEKSVILSVLCAFISYSVLITQVFHK